MFHNKLVRDHIPDIIRQNGAVPTVHIATDKEYIKALKNKILEETDELLKDPSVEECADVLEVLYAICDYYKINISKIESARKKKLAQRGGFAKRIILEKTDH